MYDTNGKTLLELHERAEFLHEELKKVNSAIDVWIYGHQLEAEKRCCEIGEPPV